MSAGDDCEEETDVRPLTVLDVRMMALQKAVECKSPVTNAEAIVKDARVYEAYIKGE
jgi:hypothetical protein